MRLLSSEPEFRAAAQTRIELNAHRVALILAFAVAGGAITREWLVAALWCVAALAGQYGNRILARRVVTAAPGRDCAEAAKVFLLGTLFSSTALAAIAPIMWFLGGEAGRFAALLLSAGALINVAISAHRVKELLFMLAAPYVAMLAAPLLSPLFAGATYSWVDGAFISVIAISFLAQIKLAVDTNRRAAETIEARRAEAEAACREAEAANRAKTAFLANISHELRTPLNHIIGYGEMIQETAAEIGSLDISRDADTLLRSATRLNSLINHLLDLSRVESGDLAVELDVVPVSAFLAAMKSEALSQGAAFDIVVDQAIDFIVTDPKRLRQCLSSLLANAERQGVTEILMSVRPAAAHAEFVLSGRKAQQESAPHESASAAALLQKWELSLARNMAKQLGGDLIAPHVNEPDYAITLLVAKHLDQVPGLATHAA